jgi:hypothetical protein
MVSLKNPFLYCRLLDKEQGECAFDPLSLPMWAESETDSAYLFNPSSVTAYAVPPSPPTFGMGEGFGSLNIQRYKLSYPIAVRSCADYLSSICQRQVQRTQVR